MKKHPVSPKLDEIPEIFHPLFEHASAYDSSCSDAARVIYLDSGCYLKSAPKGALAGEAQMTRYFHSKRLAAKVLEYVSDDRDWLLTEAVKGEDCCYAEYLEQPERLCDTIAELLRSLHAIDTVDCPVTCRWEDIIAAAQSSWSAGKYHHSHFPNSWGFDSPDEAWRLIEEQGHLLTTDTLIHGDYCLPNIMLDNWRFSGLIDLGDSGASDRHMDLYWALWSLKYNLKTDRYHERFLDAYGRADVDQQRLRLIAAIEAFG